MGLIFTPPGILSNGATINGICHIYQSTKPIARADGTSLAIGDIWYNSATNESWFWNGNYWISDRISQQLIFVSSTSYTGNFPPSSLLIESTDITLAASNAFFSNQNSSNHAVINIGYLNNFANFITTSISYNTWSGSGDALGRAYSVSNPGDYPISVNLNLVVSNNGTITSGAISQLRGLYFTITTVGTPTGSISVSRANIHYRRIA